MSNKDIQSLQREFPDMTTSVLGDVLKTYNNNRNEAARVLRGIEDASKEETEKKINELQETFPQLPRQVIQAALEESGWNVDTAIVPLFNQSEELASQQKKAKQMESKKQKQAEELRRKQEEAKKQAANLMNIFNTIPKEKVQQILDKHEGDIEETTVELLGLVGQQEEETKKASEKKRIEEEKRMKEEQEQRIRELKIQALKEKFEDLTENEVVTALEKTGWDIKKALTELLTLSAAKKKRELKIIFPSFEDEEIETVLEENGFDKMKSVQALTLIRKKEEEDKKIKEEESKKKTTSQPPSTNPTLIIKKITKPNMLEKSNALGQMIEDEITASHRFIVKEEQMKQKEKDEAAQALFKNNLEKIIEDQARNNTSPGIAPLIDAIDALEKNKQPAPLSESETQEQTVQTNNDKEIPLPSASKMNEIKPTDTKIQVSFSVKTPVIDIGNPIVVDWEMTAGQSNPWDWIGLYPCDKPNKQYITYQWAGKQLSKGTLTFTAPAVYGDYEFRYFPNGNYEHVAKSDKVKVGPQIQVVATLDKAANKIKCKWTQFSGNSYSRAWIGLYEKNETVNNLYIKWEYANKPNNEVAFDAPFKPREYELRFFTNSYVDVARSNSIRIEGQDTMSATIEDDSISVKLCIVSVDPYNDNAWLGIYFTHESNNRQWRRYKRFTNRTGEVKFNAPRTPGEYEVRMFANKTYDLILKSNKFNLPGKK